MSGLRSVGLSAFVLFVFFLSLQCLRDALVMSQAFPQVSIYLMLSVPRPFSSRSLQYPVLRKTIFKIYQGTEKTIGPHPKVFSLSDDYFILIIDLRYFLLPVQHLMGCVRALTKCHKLSWGDKGMPWMDSNSFNDSTWQSSLILILYSYYTTI